MQAPIFGAAMPVSRPKTSERTVNAAENELERALSRCRQGHWRSAIEHAADAINMIAQEQSVHGGAWY